MNKTMKRIYAFFWGVWERISDGHFGQIAAGAAFYAMFSVFPGLAAIVAIWGLMADPKVITGYLEVMEPFLPEEADALISSQIMGLVNAPAAALGWATLLSIGVALLSARNGVSSLVNGLNMVHRAPPRGLISGFIRDILLTLALIAAFLAALATAVVVPVLLSYVPLEVIGPGLLRWLPWAVMFLLILSCLSILYQFGPNLPPEKRSGWYSPGVICAALAWSVVSMGFSLYLENFNSYNRIYGSLGAAIILMMWLYLSVWAILAGGAIDAELYHRRRILRQMGKR